MVPDTKEEEAVIDTKVLNPEVLTDTKQETEEKPVEEEYPQNSIQEDHLITCR